VADLRPSAFDPADWIRQPDATGRWGWQRLDSDPADWPEFESLLDETQAFDVDTHPNTRLANLVAQKRARLLLARADDYFLED
jgi:hypothetical protein